jgi:hypothetical protein
MTRPRIKPAGTMRSRAPPSRSTPLNPYALPSPRPTEPKNGMLKVEFADDENRGLGTLEMGLLARLFDTYNPTPAAALFTKRRRCRIAPEARVQSGAHVEVCNGGVGQGFPAQLRSRRRECQTAGAVLTEEYDLGGQTLGGQTLGGQTLGGQTLGGQTLGGQTLGGTNAGGDKRWGGQTLGGQTRGGQTLATEAFWGAGRPLSEAGQGMVTCGRTIP